MMPLCSLPYDIIIYKFAPIQSIGQWNVRTLLQKGKLENVKEKWTDIKLTS